MKKWKKTLCITLAVLLVLGLLALSACGSFTPRMAIGMQKMSALQSFHTDTTLTADLTVQTFGVETPLRLVVTAAVDHQKDPALTAMDLSATVFDVTEGMLLVVEQGEGSRTVYSSFDGGKSWISETTTEEPASGAAAAEPADGSASEAQPVAAGDLLKLAIALSESFEEAEAVETEEIVEDGAAVRYEGTIPAALLREVLANTDAPAVLAEMSAQYDLPLEKMVENMIADVPAAVELDRESNMLMHLELDLTQMLDTLLAQIMELVLGGYGLPADTVEIRIDSVRTATDFSGFDSVTVTAPKMYSPSD